MINNNQKKYINLSCGKIAYLEGGKKNNPPVLLVHGIPTSGWLWREVIRYLEVDYNCYAPDLMGLGDTFVDINKNLFNMQAQAEMLVEFMQKQGHKSFHLICHDQGGAAGQIIASQMPDLVNTLVLTDCVCYDNWPVPTISRWQTFVKFPLIPEYIIQTGIVKFLETSTPFSAFRKGVYNPEKLSNETIMEYLRPLHETSMSRKLFLKFLLAGNPRYTLEAISGLKKFTKPTLVIWSGDDYYISPSWGKRLSEDIPGVKNFELIPFSGHFWQEEKSDDFSSKIGFFLETYTK